MPSRRLDRSLGINTIPPKVCSYTCVYCQLGRTTCMQTRRATFRDPWHLLRAVQGKLMSVAEAGQTVDYLTFVPDGEPTLDLNLGREIDLLHSLGIPVVVISNASLLAVADVREDVMRADLVSFKVDAAQEAAWRRVDRPHGALRFGAIRDGLLSLARSGTGWARVHDLLASGRLAELEYAGHRFYLRKLHGEVTRPRSQARRPYGQGGSCG
ncbi:MAG TPA: hypothetical protein PLJ35_07450 [Anaerolineae bacterium]|nr:hypothetical protein [Anaerolineae bacterium]HOQ98642.1 hypothetical protein [Anaerolineae bacterium]HPL28256.1 hypothetical protein [Anaerolineae bacterium]